MHAVGDYLMFLNDDTEVISEDWLENMLQLVQRKEVGAVGAKLIYENNTIQHGGVTFSNGLPDHIFKGKYKDDPGYFFNLVTNRNYLAVTGAAMITKKSDFDLVKGFEEKFKINWFRIDKYNQS